MNTSSIAHAASTQSLRRGITVVGALLISGAVFLGLVNRAAINSMPTAPAASVSAAQERFAAFKQRQAEQVADAAMVLAPAPATGWARYVAFKDAQAEASDTTVLPAPTRISARERYLALKDRQAQICDVGDR